MKPKKRKGKKKRSDCNGGSCCAEREETDRPPGTLAFCFECEARKARTIPFLPFHSESRVRKMENLHFSRFLLAQSKRKGRFPLPPNKRWIRSKARGKRKGREKMRQVLLRKIIKMTRRNHDLPTYTKRYVYTVLSAKTTVRSSSLQGEKTEEEDREEEGMLFRLHSFLFPIFP